MSTYEEIRNILVKTDVLDAIERNGWRGADFIFIRRRVTMRHQSIDPNRIDRLIRQLEADGLIWRLGHNVSAVWRITPAWAVWLLRIKPHRPLQAQTCRLH